MGAFYVNYTLRGPTQQSVAAALTGRSAIVTRMEKNCVVVVDEESDEQDQELIAEFGKLLSDRFNCPLLAVLNHDDDILWYQLYVNGDLADQYDSTPGYFDSEASPEAFIPTGGDAQTLCRAFESNAVEEVSRILRKSRDDAGGYVFATERHSDLATALGLPQFSVAAGFEYFTAGELFHDLEERDLLHTKELVAQESDSLTHYVSPRLFLPGYYQSRARDPNRPGRFKKPIPSTWMPQTWADLSCAEQELSSDFFRAVAGYREQFKQLGFTELNFKKIKNVLNPHARENGGINYRAPDGACFGQIIYNRAHLPPPVDKDREQIIIAFTAIFPDGNLSCTNNLSTALEPPPKHKVIRMDTKDVAALHKQFVIELARRSDAPRHFSDLASLQSWFDSNARETFEFHVRQGVWVRMSDYEVEIARKQLPPPMF
jgi:hypothetical protein